MNASGNGANNCDYFSVNTVSYINDKTGYISNSEMLFNDY